MHWHKAFTLICVSDSVCVRDIKRIFILYESRKSVCNCVCVCAYAHMHA